MNIMQYTLSLIMVFTLVFAGHAEAKGKHGSEKARSRVMKEISQKVSPKVKSSTVKEA